MADFTQARRALIDTEGDDEDHYLYTNVPRRALVEEPQMAILEPLRSPVGPILKAVLWTEGAVILLLVSILTGLKVLPWLMYR
jgi:hypothetical protein